MRVPNAVLLLAISLSTFLVMRSFFDVGRRSERA